jgi:hypothetical protein
MIYYVAKSGSLELYIQAYRGLLTVTWPHAKRPKSLACLAQLKVSNTNITFPKAQRRDIMWRIMCLTFELSHWLSFDLTAVLDNILFLLFPFQFLDFVKAVLLYMFRCLVLWYSVIINPLIFIRNTVTCPQRVSLPLKKTMWYVRRGLCWPCHPVGCNSLLQIEKAACCTFFKILTTAKSGCGSPLQTIKIILSYLIMTVCRVQEDPKGSKGTLRPDFRANIWPMFFLSRCTNISVQLSPGGCRIICIPAIPRN